MLKYRIITSVMLIPLVIFLLFYLSQIAFMFIVAFMCTIAIWEWSKLIGIKSHQQCVYVAVLYNLLLFFIHFNNHQLDIHLKLSILVWISLILWSIALLLVLIYPNSVVFYTNLYILRLIFGILIINVFFESIMIIYHYHNYKNTISGSLCLFFIIISVWTTDTSSYICGKVFGKHQMTKKISPNKTWEGFIGGFIASTIINLILLYLTHFKIPIYKKIIFSIIITLASVLGDLTISMFKREAGVKDSSNLIPGHGGVLDRIDSMTAAIPICFCLFFNRIYIL